MTFSLVLVAKVNATIQTLSRRDQVRYKKVIRCLARLSEDPTYPGLASHRYDMIEGSLGEPVWESYVENNTPSAWRVWWYYGPEDATITVVDLGPHP